MRPKKFEIVLAETAGFCMGVQRAVRMVLDAAEDPRTSLPIRTPGPLIHNRQVLQVLEKQGVLEMGDSNAVGEGTAVIRAHGLSRVRQEELRQRCAQLLDATCPHVRWLQEIVEDHADRGYLCIVVGDRGHAEVEAALSYAGESGRVIAGPQEVGSLPAADRVVVVAQTTQDEEVFRATVEAVRQRYGECESFETICRSTSRRQAEVRKLAGEVEAMIIVGGHNSANTRRLAEISRALGTPAYHVETERELDVNEILEYRKVGLTAGASTPSWMIRRVVHCLRDEDRRRSRPVWSFAHAMADVLIYSNLYAAGALAVLTFAASQLLGRPLRLPSVCMAVSFLFLLAQEVLNQYARRQSLYLSEPARSDFFMKNERTLLGMGIVSSLLCLVLAFFLGPWAFGLVAFGSAAGLLYRLRLPRRAARWTGWRSVAQAPASKEVFVGLAWAALAVAVPALSSGVLLSTWKAALVAFVVCFLMAFQRTLALDLRDVQTDQIVGRETLVSFMGPRASARLFFELIAVQAVVLLGAGLSAWAPSLSFVLLLSCVYSVATFVVLRRSGSVEETLAEALVDGQFYLVGLLTLTWMHL